MAKKQKTVLEHFLDTNKKMILASRYQNTIYNGKTLCEYFGVESTTKKEGNSLEELINEAIFELPAFDYEHFLKNINLYKKYSYLCLRVWMSLYPISRLIKHFASYEDKEWFPILCQGIRWCSNRRRITYINTNTLKKKEEVLLNNQPDVKITEKLFEKKRVEYLMKAKWADYEPFITELKESYAKEEEEKELAELQELDKELEKVRDELKAQQNNQMEQKL